MEAGATPRPSTPLAGRGAQEREHRGVDLSPESRPGVPMEAAPHPAEGAHWERPERQKGEEGTLHRAGLERPTPVFGTAQPPHGASGILRRAAYGIPEHQARHWMLLMLADRVDVLESRLGPRLAEPLERAGMAPLARQVERNPVATLLGAVAGVWLLGRMVR